jgi:hypothetical protein
MENINNIRSVSEVNGGGMMMPGELLDLEAVLVSIPTFHIYITLLMTILIL